MNANLNIGQLVGQIVALLQTITGYGILLLIAGSVVQIFGVRIPYVPAIDQTHLAYLAGAWWLYRK